MSFFTSSDFTTGQKLLEVIYIVIGLITLYTGIKNARDKENPSRFGTALFWCTLGVVLAFGRWIPPKAVGVLVLIMTIPAIFKKVKIGKVDAPSEESMKAMFEKVGMKVFLPALSIGVFAILFAIGMMLFTIIMGNGFAAITVMTVGIGAPFVLNYGANPVVIGMIALTCGYCGTLCTPMAANFNIVPVAMLDMKDKWGVIKNQIVPALFLIVFQIIYMIIAK